MKNIILLFLTINLTAQTLSADLLHEGVAITNRRDTIKGSIMYNIPLDIIHVIDNGMVRTMSSNQLFYFEIFDRSLDSYRQFYSLPLKVDMGYYRISFLELVYEDLISLMVREKIIIHSDFYGFQRRGVDYEFYFINKSGKITHYKGKRQKRKLLQILPENQKYMRKIIRKHHLDTWKLSDLILITAIYNGQLRT